MTESSVFLASKILTRYLDKIVDKNHVSNLCNSYIQARYEQGHFTRSLTRIMSQAWIILASKILTTSLDKNHVRILGNSCKQDTDKDLDKNHVRILGNSGKQETDKSLEKILDKKLG